MVIAMTRLLRRCALLPALVFLTVVFQLTVLFQFEAAAQVSTSRSAKLATEHNRSAIPPDDLVQAGNKIVNIPSCPSGVIGRNPKLGPDRRAW